LGDTAGEGRPPNVARMKNVPEMLDPYVFGDGLGEATQLRYSYI
jgi:hypothetical protein